MNRCPWAITIGSSMSTRCIGEVGHEGGHVGRGLRRFPDQRIQWSPGDRRQFLTSRTDRHAWEPGPPADVDVEAGR